MSGDGRKLHVIQNWPGIDEIVWVPIVTGIPWRDDEQDRIPTEHERTAS